jgi:hypothetical protein
MKRNSTNTDITINADGFDISGGITARKLTVSGADIAVVGSGTNTYTFPAAASTLQATTADVQTDHITETTAAHGVTIDGLNIKDNLVVGGSSKGVNNSSLDTTAGNIGGAWLAWTPSLTNWAVGTGGSAALTAYYTQIGKTIHFVLNATLGTSGQSMGTSPTFSVPVTATSRTHNLSSQYNVGGAGAFIGIASVSATTATMFYHAVSGANVKRTNITATAPATWAAGDIVRVSGTYEAA